MGGHLREIGPRLLRRRGKAPNSGASDDSDKGMGIAAMNMRTFENASEAYANVADPELVTALLVLGIEGCTACELLREDFPTIVAGTGARRSVYICVRPDDEDAMAVAGRLHPKDFPTIYLFSRGKLLTGWARYDVQWDAEQRTASLIERINAAIASRMLG